MLHNLCKIIQQPNSKKAAISLPEANIRRCRYGGAYILLCDEKFGHLLIGKNALIAFEVGPGKASVFRKLIEKLYALMGIFRTKRSWA